ncbi:MAG: hypothetical protein Q7J77_05635, partial [Undibacterium sp.]|nr:hypothetical protein [Undibacterium sp.]
MRVSSLSPLQGAPVLRDRQGAFYFSARCEPGALHGPTKVFPFLKKKHLRRGVSIALHINY